MQKLKDDRDAGHAADNDVDSSVEKPKKQKKSGTAKKSKVGVPGATLICKITS